MKLDGVFVYVSFWLFLLLRISKTLAEKSCILSEGKVKFPDSHIIVTYSRYSIPMAHEDVIRYDYMRRMDKEHVKSYERRFIVEDKDKKNRTASKTINKNSTRPTSGSAKRSVITKSHWREVNQELNFTEDATLDLMWYAKKYVNLTNFASIIKPTIRQLYERKTKEQKSKKKERRKLKKGKIKRKKRRKRYTRGIDSLLSAFRNISKSPIPRNMSESKILRDISESKVLRNSSERKIWKFLRINSESNILRNTSASKILRNLSDSNIWKKPSERKILRSNSESKILRNTSDWKILRNSSESKILRNTSDWKILKNTSQRKVLRNTSNISLKIEKTWKIINAINNRTIIDPRKHGSRHNSSLRLTNKTFNYTVPNKYKAIAKMNPPIWRKLQVVKHTIKANLKLLKHPGNLSEHKPFKDVLVSDIFLLRRFEGYILHEIDAILKSKNMSLLGNSTDNGGNASTNSINATRDDMLLRNNATNVTLQNHATNEAQSNGTLVCFKLSIQPKKVLRRLGWKVKLKEYQIIIGTPQDETNIPLCVVNKDIPKISGAQPANKRNKKHKKGKKKKKSKSKSRKQKSAKSQEKGDRTKRGTNQGSKQKDVKQKNNIHKYGSKGSTFSARDIIAKREDYMKAKYYGERGQMLDQGSSVCVRVVS